jgi:hypothetical protein
MLEIEQIDAQFSRFVEQEDICSNKPLVQMLQK